MPCILSARDITVLYPVAMDTHRTLEKGEKMESLSYSKRSYKAALRVSYQTSIELCRSMTEEYGQLDDKLPSLV